MSGFSVALCSCCLIFLLARLGGGATVVLMPTGGGEIVWSLATWSPRSPVAGDDVVIDLSNSTSFLTVDVNVPASQGFFASLTLTSAQQPPQGCSAMMVANQVVLSATSMFLGRYSKVMLALGASLNTANIVQVFALLCCSNLDLNSNSRPIPSSQATGPCRPLHWLGCLASSCLEPLLSPVRSRGLAQPGAQAFTCMGTSPSLG